MVNITLLAFAAMTACPTSFAEQEDARLRSDLERVSQSRIFFGHQSVGLNIIDGITQLSKDQGIPLRIVQLPTAGPFPAATLGHAFLAKNGNPQLKIQSFDQALQPYHDGPDIALMKFCFVDFTADSNAKALFARYQEAINIQRAKHPGTTFVHVTEPLTVVEGGPKAKLLYFLGYAPLYGTLENMRRNEYNTLLRKAYQGREPIFDLAHVESSRTDGRSETVKWNGEVIPVMVPEFTDDGGHLNAVGRLRAAREFLTVLAAIPTRAGTK